MRTTALLTAALLGVSFGVANPALSAPGVGDAAPAFDGKGYHNTPPISMSDLKGRVILLEIFRTW